MASQVPYTGTPSVAPENNPTPMRSADTPLGAFGGAVAQATQHLGEVAQGAGNELFARGAAMQQLNEEARSSEATTNFQIQSGELYAKYRSLEGKDAVDGYRPFVQAINDLRAKTREDLSSPFAQHAYDTETRNSMSRTIFSAAAHSGDQNKAFVLGTNKARVEADANTSAMHPEDNTVYEQGIQTGINTGKQSALIHGQGEDFANNEALKNTTGIVTSRVTSLMQKDPVAAQAVLDDARKRGIVDGDTADKLGKQIESTTYNKTSVAESAKIFNDPANKDATAADLVTKAEAKAQQMFPDNAVFKDKLVQQTLILRARQETYKRADEYDRMTVLQGAVYGVGAKDGKLPGSVDELDPKARAAYDNANERTQAAIQRRLMMNAKGDYAPTPQNQAEYNRIRGALTDPTATADERDKALNMDMNNLAMPAPQARQLIDLRNQLYSKTLNTNALPKAMSILAPIINAPEIGLSKRNNPNDYNRFVGALSTALEQGAKELNRSLNDDEIKKIGSMLLQKSSVPGRIWGTNEVRGYQANATEQFRKTIIGMYAERGVPPPEESDIQRLYAIDQLKRKATNINAPFTELFGKTTNRATTGSAK